MNQVRKYWLGLIMIGGLAVIAVAGGDVEVHLYSPFHSILMEMQT